MTSTIKVVASDGSIHPLVGSVVLSGNDIRLTFPFSTPEIAREKAVELGLTKEVGFIQRKQAREAVNEAVENVKRLATIGSIVQLEDAVKQLKEATQTQVRVIQATTSYTLRDNRPRDWQNGWHFKVPSRSGESDGHEVIVVGDESSCNCPAARFDKKCWAREEAESFVGRISFREAGYRVQNPSSDFGLIKEA
jgi:hypothetical protein